MELILSAPKDPVTALRFCRCAEKAATMKAEGYTIAPLEDVEDALMVWKPAGEFAFPTEGYAVCLRTKSCNCPDFQKRGEICKHLVFVAEELRQEERARWEAICAEVDANAAYEDIAHRM